MKILLSWLLDYIDCQLSDLDITKIVDLFNIRTAEIESFQQKTLPLKDIFLGQITDIKDAKVSFFCPELNKTISMPLRSDAIIGKTYLAISIDAQWRWVVLADFDPEKEGIMPAIYVAQKLQTGEWRKMLFATDYVLEIDNKSINHRPDLWGHYGIACEIAAFLNLPLRPMLLANQPVVSYPAKSENISHDGLSVTIQDGAACSRFAALLYDKITYQDSALLMAIRLAYVGAKPINAMIDTTNYVMFDIGHPMHVFDASAFENRKIIARQAKATETLPLLDGQIAQLTPKDLVIANDTQAVSVAGIMGGKQSSYQQSTQAIVLEAAGFDPEVIRKTAQRLKIRTEASMRFEKHLDPMQNVVVIQRFLYLAKEAGLLNQDNSYPIISVGRQISPQSCTVSHQFIQARLGMDIAVEFVLQALKKLHFKAVYEQATDLYQVTIPTNRATKDIRIAEDIVEEVIRSYGLENIIPKIPAHQMIPHNIRPMSNIRAIKQQLAYGMAMHEVRDYMMYDASWISRLQIDLTAAISVKSPLSQNWTTLVTSLIPHLLKSVETNSVHHDHLRFFEYNRVWSKTETGYVEQKVLAGIIFDKKSLNFYECKAELEPLWSQFGLNVTYRKSHKTLPVWYDQNQSAELVVDDRVIGTIGMISIAWMHSVLEASAFIFEIDGDFLENIKQPSTKFTAWSKFQDTTYDISLFVPLAISSSTICSSIQHAHTDIKQVQLIDFFEKDEWKDYRAMTLRYTVSNHEKTMTKQDLENVVQAVHKALKVHNVQIR